MEQKVAGSYFINNDDRVEDIVVVTVDEIDDNNVKEITISTRNGDVMVCMSIDDFKRVAEKIIAED